jgi:hypothetical protein
VKESTAVAAAVGVEEEEMVVMMVQAHKEPDKQYILKSTSYIVFP